MMCNNGNTKEQEFPPKVKLNFSTNLEIAAGSLLALSFLVPGSLIHYFWDSPKPEVHVFNIYTFAACLFVGFVFFLFKNIDEYFMLDSDRQALMYKSKIFSKETYTVFAHYRNIDAVVTNSCHHYYKERRRGITWAYRAEIILNTGKIIPISDWNTWNFDESRRTAELFSKISNVPLVKGKKNYFANPARIEGKYTFIIHQDAAKAANLRSYGGQFYLLLIFSAFTLGILLELLWNAIF